MRVSLSKKEYSPGFTLLEIMAVLILIGFLLAFTPKWDNSITGVGEEIHEINKLMIEEGVRLYKIDVGVYPEKLDDLLVCPPGLGLWRGPYLKEKPVNPLDKRATYSIEMNGKVRISKE